MTKNNFLKDNQLKAIQASLKPKPAQSEKKSQNQKQNNQPNSCIHFVVIFNIGK